MRKRKKQIKLYWSLASFFLHAFWLCFVSQPSGHTYIQQYTWFRLYDFQIESQINSELFKNSRQFIDFNHFKKLSISSPNCLWYMQDNWRIVSSVTLKMLLMKFSTSTLVVYAWRGLREPLISLCYNSIALFSLDIKVDSLRSNELKMWTHLLNFSHSYLSLVERFIRILELMIVIRFFVKKFGIIVCIEMKFSYLQKN